MMSDEELAAIGQRVGARPYVRKLLDEVKRLQQLLDATQDAAFETAERERLLRAGIEVVLNDSETGAGGWGPDVTMAHVLRALLDDDTEKPEPMVAESSWDSLAAEMTEVEAERDWLREWLSAIAGMHDGHDMECPRCIARKALDDAPSDDDTEADDGNG